MFHPHNFYLRLRKTEHTHKNKKPKQKKTPKDKNRHNKHRYSKICFPSHRSYRVSLQLVQYYAGSAQWSSFCAGWFQAVITLKRQKKPCSCTDRLEQLQNDSRRREKLFLSTKDSWQFTHITCRKTWAFSSKRFIPSCVCLSPCASSLSAPGSSIICVKVYSFLIYLLLSRFISQYGFFKFLKSKGKKKRNHNIWP